MSASGQQAGASRLAWALHNERFSDMTVILSTPGAMEEALNAKEAPLHQQKKARTSKKTQQQQAQKRVQQALLDKGGVQMKASRVILASASEYFRKRLEGWVSDPWTMTGADGKPLLVVGVEDEMVDTAQAVVKLIYEEHVPEGLGPVQLAKMCRLADMWDASACVALCATALTQLKHDSLQPREFAAAMALLPETVSLTPQVASWQASATPAFVQRYSDVHALLTSPDQLLTFRQLPYCVVRAWAGSASDSDGLVIDREESVVVALEWWRKGAEGRKCSKAQLKELTGLVRVCHTSAVFRLLVLPKLPWFRAWEDHLEWLTVARSNGVMQGTPRDFPAAWLGPPRKQLDASELKQRCTISWDVPKAALEASLNGGPLQNVSSQTIYMAGTGVELYLSPTRRQDGAVEYGLFLRTTSYIQHGTTLCQASSALSCQYEIQRQAPGMAQMCRVLNSQATLRTCGWGRPAVIVASSPAELEPYLVDGHLRLKATVSMIQRE